MHRLKNEMREGLIHAEKRKHHKRSPEWNTAGELLLPASNKRDKLRSRIVELENEIESLEEFDSASSANFTEQISALQQRNRDLQAIVDILENAHKLLEQDYIQQINKLSNDVRDLTERLKQQYQTFLPESCIRDIEAGRFDIAEKKLREFSVDTDIAYVVNRVYKNNTDGRFRLLMLFGSRLKSIQLSLSVYTCLDSEMRNSKSPDVFQVFDLIEALKREVVDQANVPFYVNKTADDLLAFLKDRVKNMAAEVLMDVVKRQNQNKHNTTAVAISSKVYLLGSGLYLNMIRGITDNIYGKVNTEDILKLIEINTFIAQNMAVCLAVFDKIKTNGHTNTSISLKLAGYIRRIMSESNYRQVNSVDRLHFESIKKDLPTSSAALGFASTVCIKSSFINEYLYAANDAFNFDSERRRVFTWTPRNRVSNGLWKIEVEGKYFSLKNTEFNEYLFVSPYSYVDLMYRGRGFSPSPKYNHVFTWIKGTKVNNGDWEFLSADGNNVEIRSTYYNHSLFSIDLIYGEERRRVFAAPGIGLPLDLWKFEDCSETNRRRRAVNELHNVEESNVKIFERNIALRLNFSQQVISSDGDVVLYRSGLRTDGSSELYVVDNGGITRYRHDRSMWIREHSMNDLHAQQIYLTDLFNDGQLGLAAKTEHGLRFYIHKNNNFNLLMNTEDFGENEFSDVYYGWSGPENFIKFGHFYNNLNLLGMLTYRKGYGLVIYAVIKDLLYQGRYPVARLRTNTNLLGNCTQVSFELSNLNRNGQDNIIVRNATGLNIFRLNERNRLEHMMQVPISHKYNYSEEKLFFPNLTGQQLRDIVIVNSSGMYVYQFNSTISNYDLLQYQPMLSKSTGWEQKYTRSIKFEDVNSDGRDDMLFTASSGINILTFNYFTNEWQPLLDTSNLSISQRYGSVLKVFPPIHLTSKYPVVFTKHKNEMHWANITNVEYVPYSLRENQPKVPLNASSWQEPSTVVPEMYDDHFEEDKPHLLLRDQLDYSSIMDAVRKNIGKVTFNLPLIDLSNMFSDLVFSVSYNGVNKISGNMGVGWSIPQNFIAMDHQSSIFPEDEKYYIILQDLPRELIPDSDKWTENIYSFTLIDGQSDLRILYFRDKERWELNNAGVKMVYGCAQNEGSDPVNWEVKWKHWRGTGSSFTGLEQFAAAWYLVEVNDENNLIRYTYDAINVAIADGKTFTREIFLKTISDDKGNKIVFNYNNKDITEFKLLPLSDQRGNLNTQTVQTQFLTGYRLSTQKYQQSVNFIYKVENGKRFLIKIEQERDITNQPVLQFSYSNASNYFMLDGVVLPTGVSVKIQYKLLVQLNNENILKKAVNVEQRHRVDYGDDSVLVTYLDDAGRVILRMFNAEMTKEMYSSLSRDSSLQFPLVGKSAAKSHIVSFASDFIAVVVYYDKNQELYLLKQKEGKWESILFTFSAEAVISPSTDFIVVANDKPSIEIISWNKESNEWRKSSIFTQAGKNNTPILLQVSARGFIFYVNDILSIGYRDRDLRWQIKTIKSVPGVLHDIEYTLNKFNLDEKLRNSVFTILKGNALQISNNIIFLNRWRVEGTKIYSVIDLIVLDKSYDLAKEKTLKLFQDDLMLISHWSDDGSGSSFKLAYDIVNDKFNVIAKDVRGSIIDKINHQTDNFNRRHDAKMEILNSASKLLENPSKKPFLLNPFKYLAVLKQAVVIFQNKKFIFTGDEWDEKPVSESELNQEKVSIPLGKNIVLRKENSKSSFKLYNRPNDKEERILDLEINYLNQTLVRYPMYLAYQPSNKPISVVKFGTDGSFDGTFDLSWEETLSLFSSYQTLVTSVERFDGHGKTLFLRPLFTRIIPDSVVTKVTINFDKGCERVTGFEYNRAKALGSVVYYENVSTLPGNDKKSFGWIEETYFKSHSLEKIFDSQGLLVKSITSKHGENDTNTATIRKKSPYLHTTLLDTTGRLEVAQFFPYDIESEEVGYYGFENYEINRIGKMNSKSGNKWVFEETGIVRDGFSFTGRNYLRLSGKSLIGEFQPEDQHQAYMASCWVRPENEIFNLGDIVPHLKAYVFIENKNETVIPFGEVKLQQGNWFYLEATVDLFYFNIFKKISDLQPNKSFEKQEGARLTISIVVAPSANSTLHVDHVRFSPLESNFRVNVYDSMTRQTTEVISASGLVERQIYDKYQKLVGSVNGYGELKQVTTYTKSSSIGRIIEPKSIVLIQPSNGFYEDFSFDSFNKRWKVDKADAWKIYPRSIYHLSNSSNILQLNPTDIDQASYGLRFCFSLHSENSIIEFNNNLQIIRRGKDAEIRLSGKGQSTPLDAELLIIVEGERLFVWVDGGLYFDGFLDVSLFHLKISGKVQVSDLILFSRPSVAVTYMNSLKEKLQEIVLEHENASVLTEYLYDELGRQTITTQPVRLKGLNILTYYQKFITNRNPYSSNSVWKVGELQGEVTTLTEAYSYSRVQYCANPLNEKCAIGLAGKDFSLSGPYAKRFAYSSDNLFINNHYPESKNYSYVVEHKPGKIEHITVYDSEENKVALYVKVPKGKDLLSTYEYDGNGCIVKILSPLYHEKAGTFYKLNSARNRTPEEQQILQDSLIVKINYDAKRNIKTKEHPDSGQIENVYNKDGLLRYVLYYADSNIKNVVYHDYDEQGRLKSRGQVISKVSKGNLPTLSLSTSDVKVYQEFYYNDDEHNPLLRGKAVRMVTFNEEESFIEESILNIDDGILSKRIIVTSAEDNDKPVLVSINKKYAGGKLIEIEYPINILDRPLKIKYKYDKLGRIEGIGVNGEENLFAMFTYNAYGQVSDEIHLPDLKHMFSRQYSYNAAGFLTQLKDNFLTENIYYTTGSYGGYGYGDGIITRTEFTATWHDKCDDDLLGLNELSFTSEGITSEVSALCFRALKNAGYINDRGHQENYYYAALEFHLPNVCNYGATGYHVQNILGKRGFPTQYGHSYDYGNYQDLTKAKYFVGGDVPMPLQPYSFAKGIPTVNNSVSFDIWEKLKYSGHLIQDSDKVDMFLGHGKRGKPFVREQLSEDLKNINSTYERYELLLEKLLVEKFSRKQDSSSLKLNLENALSGKKNNDTKIAANEILQMLEQKGYLLNPFSKNFNDALQRYHPLMRDIVRVLSEHFAKQLGEAIFDVESYNIDANGNHKHFYTGFDRYEIRYRDNSNQISTISLKPSSSFIEEQHFIMKHDARGNVIQASHKGIERIDYSVVSNRATHIKLTDGRMIKFSYDARDERILKTVLNSSGETEKEINYIRDEFGRSLVERETTYIGGDTPPAILITAYIYGPKGILGFIRNDEFYSVITDHEGSVRLVVRGDEVVTAYDYLPYGSLMRKYESDRFGKISYRYTGQEWDEETGLYNYHARFYDPSIGRFFQIDPKEQYFSPYKYAGNSPVSMIDMDGEFAFLLPLIVFGALAGAYLGGAAANNRWNPAEWDFKSKETWFGTIGGAVAGGFLPVGFVGSANALITASLSAELAYATTTALGLGGGYLSMAATNNEWNPGKWNLKSPETWNAAFQGFALGSSIPGGIHGSVKFYKFLSSAYSKGAFISGSTLAGGGLLFINGDATHWDFSKPAMYYGFLDAITGASDLPILAHSGYKFVKKGISKVKKRFHNRNYDRLPTTDEHLIDFTDGNSVQKTGFYGVANFINTNGLNYIMKAAGITGLPFIYTFLRNGLDMSDPNTYRDLFGTAITVKQIFLAGKYGYKRYSTNKFSKDLDKKRMFSKQIAEDVVESYKRELNDYKTINKLVETKFKSLKLGNEKEQVVHRILKEAIWSRMGDIKINAKLDGVVEGQSNVILDHVKMLYNRFRMHETDIEGNIRHNTEEVNVREPHIEGDLPSLTHEDVKKIDETVKAILSRTVLYYSTQEVSGFQNVEIANRAVSIAVTDKIAAVGFSGKGFGLIAFYTHKNFENQKIAYAFLQKDNTKIAGKELVISHDPTMNQIMIDRLKHNQDQILAENIEELRTDISTGEFSKMSDSDLGLDGNGRDTLFQFLQEKLQNNEWLSPRDLKNKIMDILVENDSDINQLLTRKEHALSGILDIEGIPGVKEIMNLQENTNQLQYKLQKEKNEFKRNHLKRNIEANTASINEVQKKNSLSDYETLMESRDTLLQTIHDIEHKIDIDTKEIRNRLKNSLDTNILLAKVTDLDKRLAPWEHTNCAESHVITALIRAKEIVPHLQVKGPIKSLATYKLLNSGESLIAFDRCSSCVLWTMPIEHTVISENFWDLRIKEKLINARDKITIYGKVPNFSIHMANTTAKKEHSNSVRRKRSIFIAREDEEATPYVGNNTDGVDSIQRQSSKRNTTFPYRENVTSGATRPSFVNRIYGWFNRGAQQVNKLVRFSDTSGDFDSGKNGGQMYQSVADANGTILLLDMLLRKITGEKHTYNHETMIPEQEASAHAINIVGGFEAILDQAARNNQMPIITFDIDFSKAQADVAKKIRSGKYEDISSVLNSYAERACLDQDIRVADKLRPNKCYNFKREVNDKVDELLNDSIFKIMNGKSTV